MAGACFASLAILAGSIAALYGLEWYKNKRRQNKTKKSAIGKNMLLQSKNSNQSLNK
jgi:hypothetical protein